MSKPLFISGYECVTVGELIAHLQRLPQDASCVFSLHSDYAALTINDIQFFGKEQADKRDGFVYRTGGVRRVYPYGTWGDEKPEFVTVVAFPGN